MSKELKAIQETLNNPKATKADLTTALNTAIGVIKARTEGTFNPVAQAAAKQAETVATTAKKTVEENLALEVTGIGSALSEIVDKLVVIINDGNEKYAVVSEAVAAQEAKLEELLGIEAKVLSMATLINAENDLREKLSSQTADLKASLNGEIESLKETISEMKKSWIEEQKEYSKTTLDSRRKEQEEFDYNLKRSRTQEKDAWADKMASEKKAFYAGLEIEQNNLEATRKEIDERETAVTERENKVDELEAKVAGIPALIAEAEDKGAKAKEKELKQSFYFEKSALENNFKSEKAQLDFQIKTLQGNATRDAETIADLKSKLDAAYEKIETMANKAVEGASGMSYIKNLEKIVADTTASKNNGK